MYLSIFVLTSTLLAFAYALLLHARRSSTRQKQTVLSDPKRLPLWDPFFGTDLNITILGQILSSRLLQGIDERLLKYGTTHAFPLGTTSIIATSEPANIKFIHTNAKDFPVGKVRRQGMSILHGRGIFAVEGEDWRQSRAVLRPAFAKGRHDDISVLEVHFQAFLERLRSSGPCVDMQDAYHRLTLATAMEYFFGIVPAETANGDSTNKFLDSIDYVSATVYIRLVFGSSSIQALWRWLPTKKAMGLVHRFVEAHVQEALASQKATDRYVFLNELAKAVDDPILLRDQVLTSMLGGKDTTASLLSHVTFELARQPQLWSKLRSEVLTLPQSNVDMKAIRNLPFLKCCILEGLRLYTIVPINMRSASTDTSMPVGGGPTGDQPIRVAKGTVIWTCFYSMHRSIDTWGEDAHEFRPERWEAPIPSHAFAAFGLGPRTCLGQEFAMNEASFILTRLAQEFEKIESADERPWKEKVAITLGSAIGCKVKLYDRTDAIEG